jgi:iron(III) transport system ATP-binding protein
MLQLSNIFHTYDEKKILHDVSFEVGAGEILCLLGPSGCGKTTCLRLAAGLEDLQAGSIAVGGEILANGEINVPVEDRQMGFVLQDFALFPHMNVLGNVTFGLAGLPSDQQERVAQEQLTAVGLWDRCRAFPHQLSGGEQQRVALARALAPGPSVMLMDEPFSGLDVLTRRAVREVTRRLLKERDVPTLMVTHDPDEAMLIGDRIAIMDDGKLIQVGSGEEIAKNPANAFVRALFDGKN